MYTIEAWSSICFFHLYCRNVNYFLFFSCPLSKLQVLLVFLMYTIKTWSILFVFLMYPIVTWSVLVFLIYTIEISSPFCFSHVHYWIVECFLFFSCTLSECQFLFFFSLMYTIETWSVFYFSNVHYRNVKSIFSSHLHYSKVKRFCCSDVSYRKVKYFSFFSYTSSKREIFLVLPMYTTKIESSFCFSCML